MRRPVCCHWGESLPLLLRQLQPEGLELEGPEPPTDNRINAAAAAQRAAVAPARLHSLEPNAALCAYNRMTLALEPMDMIFEVMLLLRRGIGEKMH